MTSVQLNEGISIKDLIKDGVVISVETNPDATEEDCEEERQCKKNLLDYLNPEVLGGGLTEEIGYEDDKQPFEIIASKMENLTPDGRIKKRILREGYALKAEDKDLVRVHYNAYLEYTAEPFDSTYARSRTHQFMVNNGDVLIGLDIAVQSMKLNEKSQFLISPDFAYGALGCFNRVPPKAQVLFEIELMEIVNSGAEKTHQTLSEDERKKFANIYSYCQALCAKGKDLYQKNIRSAIKAYNMAVSELELVQMENVDEEMKQQELLMKLYSNLLICYTKVEEPRKGCLNFNKIQQLIKGTDLKMSAKMYYNNAKCLRMLGDFDMAKRRLDCAQRLEPKNPDVLNEYMKLEEEIRVYKQKELKWKV